MTDTNRKAVADYATLLGDNALIMGHRLSEWCYLAPTLELDVAMSNCALDYIGQARELFTYAGEITGKTEDDIAYLRDEMDYRNLLLTEMPNNDWGYSMAKLFFFSAFAKLFYEKLMQSKDETLAAIGEKSLKEVKYHLRFSSEWLIRLGDGTEESHERAQKAIDDVWMFTGEMFTLSDFERDLAEQGIAVDVSTLKADWDGVVNELLAEATLKRPENDWMQSGGKQGHHSEYMGHILSELQYMQRRFPNCQW
ncbi:1,2-phenylacetyl-CoA epoxidase subunit PaaC [Emcibacter nanhaiensis]|uniref:Phenylacetate-CoA oxygenase subunit PaaC n=1 Tax=Emcibacter nanhaiensis TaxID=1505037 RepID=A0A501PCN3_9PROT|nr:1,2-phenylacetyl-CoA epoxidase subunit PaaC [Emcibacter nanhaiensis]TPD57811.1 phenylacetate-CoA oxygenase subunit PaaC [Emcibacter nanhaiensis]